MASFQREIAAMGFSYQFITQAVFHRMNLTIFKLVKSYRENWMAGYSELQDAEFAAKSEGNTAARHQREVGIGYFDAVADIAAGGQSSTTAMAGSTETAQF